MILISTQDPNPLDFGFAFCDQTLMCLPFGDHQQKDSLPISFQSLDESDQNFIYQNARSINDWESYFQMPLPENVYQWINPDHEWRSTKIQLPCSFDDWASQLQTSKHYLLGQLQSLSISYSIIRDGKVHWISESRSSTCAIFQSALNSSHSWFYVSCPGDSNACLLIQAPQKSWSLRAHHSNHTSFKLK